MSVAPRADPVRTDHGLDATAPLPGERGEPGVRTPGRWPLCSRKAAPSSDDGATQAGGHATQVDRAPFGEERPHGQGLYQRSHAAPRARPASGTPPAACSASRRGTGRICGAGSRGAPTSPFIDKLDGFEVNVNIDETSSGTRGGGHRTAGGCERCHRSRSPGGPSPTCSTPAVRRTLPVAGTTAAPVDPQGGPLS